VYIVWGFSGHDCPTPGKEICKFLKMSKSRVGRLYVIPRLGAYKWSQNSDQNWVVMYVTTALQENNSTKLGDKYSVEFVDK
jgi:hypothetical protein